MAAINALQIKFNRRDTRQNAIIIHRGKRLGHFALRVSLNRPGKFNCRRFVLKQQDLPRGTALALNLKTARLRDLKPLLLIGGSTQIVSAARHSFIHRQIALLTIKAQGDERPLRDLNTVGDDIGQI